MRQKKSVQHRRAVVGFDRWREVTALGFQADGQTVLSVSNAGLSTWNIESGQLVKRVPARGSCLLSANGQWVLTADTDRRLVLRHAKSLAVHHRFSEELADENPIGVTVDGEWGFTLTSHETEPPSIRCWNVKQDRCVQSIAVRELGRPIVCPSGRFVLGTSLELPGAATDDGHVQLREMVLGRPLARFRAHTHSIRCLQISGDGRSLLTGAYSENLRMWRIPEYLDACPAPYMICRALSGDEQAAANSAFLQILRQARRQLQRRNLPVAVSRLQAARAVPGCDRRREVMKLARELTHHLPRRKLQGIWEQQLLLDLDASAAAVTRDGKQLLIGKHDGTIEVWSLESHQAMRCLGRHAERVTTLVLSHDGKHVASAGLDGRLHVRDVATGELLFQYTNPHQLVWSLDISHNGELVVSGEYRQFRVWEVNTGSCLHTVKAGDHWIQTLAISPDGNYVFTGNTGETVRIWSLKDGTCVSTLPTAEGPMNDACWSADGRFVLSGHGDPPADNTAQPNRGQLVIWDVVGACCQATIETPEPVERVALAVDGRLAVSSTDSGTLRLWDCESRTCLRTIETAGGFGCLWLGLSADASMLVAGHRFAQAWTLDWELGEEPDRDWEAAAWPFLRLFLSQRGYSCSILDPQSEPALTELDQDTHFTSTAWTESQLTELMRTLACAGLGWIQRDTVEKRLRSLATTIAVHETNQGETRDSTNIPLEDRPVELPTSRLSFDSTTFFQRDRSGQVTDQYPLDTILGIRLIRQVNLASPICGAILLISGVAGKWFIPSQDWGWVTFTLLAAAAALCLVGWQQAFLQLTLPDDTIRYDLTNSANEDAEGFVSTLQSQVGSANQELET